MNLSNYTAISADSGNEKRKVVAITSKRARNVRATSRAPFIPKDHRNAMTEAWLFNGVSIMKLVRSNKGLAQLDIEDALRNAILSRRSAA